MAKLSLSHFTKRLSKDQRGFSITEVLAAAAISGMVILGTSSIFVDSAKVESGQERQFWLAARRMEFQGIIRSQTGWNSILANNSDMSCFAAPTGCAAFSSPQPLKLPLDANIIDGTKTTIGMNNKGELCNTFNATNGNPLCPVGIQLHWTALCDDANCFHAQPKVTIQFQSKDVGRPLEKLSSYDLIAFKDPKLESLNEVCTAMGGVLVGITCSVTSLASACDPANVLGAGATYPLGFDATGKVLCGKPNPGSCAASDVATGFNANGGIVCAPACN